MNRRSGRHRRPWCRAASRENRKVISQCEANPAPGRIRILVRHLMRRTCCLENIVQRIKEHGAREEGGQGQVPVGPAHRWSPWLAAMARFSWARCSATAVSMRLSSSAM